IRHYMPALEKRLHYRMVDVSTIKELARRWYPQVIARQPQKHDSHRALDDIRESLEELRFYRSHVFMPLAPPAPAGPPAGPTPPAPRPPPPPPRPPAPPRRAERAPSRASARNVARPAALPGARLSRMIAGAHGARGSPNMKNTLVMIMAGGKGSRLGPLTVHR